MQEAPESVQEFRRIVRSRFWRGVNPIADAVIDDLLVWVVDDVSKRRVTRAAAAERVGDWFAKSFPYKKRKSARLVGKR